FGLRFGVCELGQDRLGALDEHAAGGGEVDAAPAPLEQLAADLALERAQLLRHRRGRERERLRGRANRPVQGDLAERAEPADVEHQLSLTIRQGSRTGAPAEPTGTVCR